MRYIVVVNLLFAFLLGAVTADQFSPSALRQFSEHLSSIPPTTTPTPTFPRSLQKRAKPHFLFLSTAASSTKGLLPLH